jgi:hypothetical protein
MIIVRFKRLGDRNPDKYHIFIKQKHKIVDVIGTITLMQDGLLNIRINYKTLFKWYKKVKLKSNDFETLINFIELNNDLGKD